MRRGTPRKSAFSLFSLSLLLSVISLAGELRSFLSRSSNEIPSFSGVLAEEERSRGLSAEVDLFQEAASGGTTRTMELEEEEEGKAEEKNAAKEEEEEEGTARGVAVVEERGVVNAAGEEEEAKEAVVPGEDAEVIPLEDRSKR